MVRTAGRWRGGERGREEEGEREEQTLICYPLNDALIDSSWDLTRYQTCSLGTSGRCSNQLSYPAGAIVDVLKAELCGLLMGWICGVRKREVRTSPRFGGHAAIEEWTSHNWGSF